jgi:hypothetical protein
LGCWKKLLANAIAKAKGPEMGKMGGQGGFHGEEGGNIFVCPESNAEQAFPGRNKVTASVPQMRRPLESQVRKRLTFPA